MKNHTRIHLTDQLQPTRLSVASAMLSDRFTDREYTVGDALKEVKKISRLLGKKRTRIELIEGK